MPCAGHYCPIEWRQKTRGGGLKDEACCSCFAKEVGKPVFALQWHLREMNDMKWSRSSRRKAYADVNINLMKHGRLASHENRITTNLPIA